MHALYGLELGPQLGGPALITGCTVKSRLMVMGSPQEVPHTLRPKLVAQTWYVAVVGGVGVS